MTLLKQLERAYVEQALRGAVICDNCGATCETFAERCTAGLSFLCPGFVAIETAKEEFRKAAK